jgi:L-lactate utilization protein LutC
MVEADEHPIGLVIAQVVVHALGTVEITHDHQQGRALQQPRIACIKRQRVMAASGQGRSCRSRAFRSAASGCALPSSAAQRAASAQASLDSTQTHECP